MACLMLKSRLSGANLTIDKLLEGLASRHVDIGEFHTAAVAVLIGVGPDHTCKYVAGSTSQQLQRQHHFHLAVGLELHWTDHAHASIPHIEHLPAMQRAQRTGSAHLLKITGHLHQHTRAFAYVATRYGERPGPRGAEQLIHIDGDTTIAHTQAIRATH